MQTEENTTDKSAPPDTSKGNEDVEMEDGEILEDKSYVPYFPETKIESTEERGKKRERDRSPLPRKRQRVETENVYVEPFERLSGEEGETLIEKFVRLVDPKPENHIPIEKPWRRVPPKLPNTPLVHVSDQTISKGLGYGLMIAGIAFSALDFYGNVFGG